MASTYTDGQQVRFTVTIKDVDGVLADPTGLTFQHMVPDTTVSTDTYPADGEPVRDSIGVFHVDKTLSNVGKHYYRWVASGAVIGAVDKVFDVKASPFS